MSGIDLKQSLASWQQGVRKDTEVRFTSDAFQPILPEESQVNPKRYGAELAWWPCQKLMAKGVPTSYPNFEDWGWFIEYLVDDNEYWLCCGNVVGSKDRGLVFLKAHAKGMFGRNRAPVEGAAPLLTQSGHSDLLKYPS